MGENAAQNDKHGIKGTEKLTMRKGEVKNQIARSTRHACMGSISAACYGRHWGVVKEIAQAALPPQEIVQQIKVEEPLFTVRVSLPSSSLEYQGRHLALTPGMVVDADVELDRLKIYQWLLEPLYRLGARL